MRRLVWYLQQKSRSAALGKKVVTVNGQEVLLVNAKGQDLRL